MLTGQLFSLYLCAILSEQYKGVFCFYCIYSSVRTSHREHLGRQKREKGCVRLFTVYNCSISQIWGEILFALKPGFWMQTCIYRSLNGTWYWWCKWTHNPKKKEFLCMMNCGCIFFPASFFCGKRGAANGSFLSVAKPRPWNGQCCCCCCCCSSSSSSSSSWRYFRIIGSMHDTEKLIKTKV